ncbi:MAG: hypothetical protein WCO77_04675, partial [bacterium]
MMVSAISANEVTANHVPRHVTILGSSCEPVIYEFADNVSAGVPTGLYSASPSRLVMIGTNETEVLQNPRFYDLVSPNSAKFRYGADPQMDDYKGLVSCTTIYGRTTVVEDGGVKVLRDENNIIRQINGVQCLVDFIAFSNRSYEIRFYAEENRGVWDGDSGLYGSLGTPFVTYRLEDPDNGVNGNTRAKFYKITGTSTNEYLYTYSSASAQWKLESGSGLRVEAKNAVWDENHENRLEARMITDGDGKVVSRSSSLFHVFPFGEQVVQTSVGVGDEQKNTVNSFYETITETGRYSRLKSTLKPDGSWVQYDYDSAGHRILQKTGFKDAGINDSGSFLQIYFDYSSHQEGDVGGVNDYLPRTTLSVLNGVTNALNFFAYYTNNAGEWINVKEQCLATTAAWGDSDNLRTVTVCYSPDADDASRGYVKSVTYPDGRKDSYVYEYGDYILDANPANCSFVPDPNGASYRTTVIHALANNSEGLPLKTTKSTTVKDEHNNTVLEEQYVLGGNTNYERIAWTVTAYNFLNKPVHVYRSDGTTADSSWGMNCCGKESETTADGIQKVYSYDLLGRMVSVITKSPNNANDDVKEDYTYDAAGSRLTEKRSGGFLSMQGSSNSYNTAGGLVSSVDSLGITTFYREQSGGRISTVIRPGLTNVTVRYLDGTTKYTMENGIIKTWTDSGINADGTRWTTSYSGAAGANSPVWQRTTTDFLGRTIKTERPGFGGAMLTSTSTYNSKGQLTSTTQQPQNSTTLSEYNELGEQTRSGLDVNTNGVLDLAGPDRVNESSTWYQKDSHQNYWQYR